LTNQTRPAPLAGRILPSAANGFVISPEILIPQSCPYYEFNLSSSLEILPMNRIFSKRVFIPPILLVTTMLLTACMEPGPIRGSIHSNSWNLRLGMTPAEVEEIIGPAQFVRVSPENALIVCRSYIYDEEISVKFVHVKFEDDAVVGASDGNKKLCNLTNKAN
jgi:hypothetical protein